MSANPTAGDEQLDALRMLYERSVRAQLDAADRLCPGADAVASRGALVAGLVLVKGLAGPAEASGGAALSGEDGRAAFAAMEALGWSTDEIFCVLSRPEPGSDPECCATRLRAVVEAVDPRVVVALDDEAAGDVARAYGLGALAPGVEVEASGRRLLAVSGLESALGDVSRKKIVWAQMQSARPDGPVY